MTASKKISEGVEWSITMLEKLSVEKCIDPILISMFDEQIDHSFCRFSEAYLKYRRVVSEWMIDVAEYFKLHPTTTHAAIMYLDRLQPNENYSRFEWQMMAVSCLLLSSKYNECEEHVPSLRKLEEITQQSVTNDCVLHYELWILKKIGWKLNARCPLAFLECYWSLGVFSSKDSSLRFSDLTNQAIVQPLYSELIDLATTCVLDSEFKKIPSSCVACALLFHLRATNGVEPVWRKDLSRLTFHDPYTDKGVQVALTLLQGEAFIVPGAEEAEREGEARDNDSVHTFSSEEDEEARAIELMKKLTSPEANKENLKPVKLSPTSIANMENM